MTHSRTTMPPLFQPHIAWCLEEGRRVSRDIGGSDPERMRPDRIVAYLRGELENGCVEMTDQPVDPKQYPMAAIVDRGSQYDITNAALR